MPLNRGRIFEPYYQGWAGQQQETSTGLGLAIAYQMVKLLQGDIRLKSEPDVGSTFTISLPEQHEQADPEAADASSEPSASHSADLN